MKNRFIRAAGVGILLVGLTTLASGQGLPGGGWYTTTTIQNVSESTTDASIDITVYAQQGQPGGPYSASFTLKQGTNRVFFPGQGGRNNTVDVTPAMPAGFQGSMVASATEPVVAIGQLSNFPSPFFPGSGTTGGYASGMFRGAADAAPRLIYPVVKNNFAGKSTIFSIQAAGQNVTINATITDGTGQTHTKNNIAIDANKSVNLIPTDFVPPMKSDPNDPACRGRGPNESACFGSLDVRATGGEIVGAVVEYSTAPGVAKLVQTSSMFGADEASNTIFCPTIKNTFTGTQYRSTGMSVANVSDTDQVIDVVFTSALGPDGAGRQYTVNNVSVPRGKSVTFSKFVGNMGGMPEGTLAAARVTTDNGSNSIVAVVNEQNFPPGGLGAPIKAVSSTCFAGASATNRVAAPLVKKDLAGSTTGVNVQNVGTGEITVQALYTCTKGANVTAYDPIPSTQLRPGQAYNFFQPAPVEAGSLCAVTVTGPANSKIIALVQETSDFSPAVIGSNGTNSRLLDTKNYEGFPLQ